ncbi:ABC transporter ATP-binding protein [Candidatus Woesearchaeota archaeon]|nr:ABC transporter ATP-binding protein [Candidatus Woesearchaeota archaeon]
MARGKSNELKEFVDYSISKGIPKEEVRKVLLESEWPKEIVDKIFVKMEPPSRKAIPSTGKDILRLANVTKAFGFNLVLDNVSISIKPGEVLGIIGLTGSGKTTLLNTMIGFVQPDEGKVVIKSPKDSKDYLISKNPEIVQEFFGFAAQHPSFYDKLTVEENVDHFASLYTLPKKERKERVNSLIKMVGLWASRKVLAQNLSGGMQKRLDIACSLVHSPRLLILDEPTADLDPVSRNKMWNLIKEINTTGTTIIMASHFVNDLEALCSRFAILHNHRLLEVGTPEELRSAYSKNYEINLETKGAKYEEILSKLREKPELKIHKTKVKENMLTLFTPKPEQTLYWLAKIIESSGDKIIHVNLNKPTIRELFESLVTR